jgi:hypothetical protein
MNQLCSFALAVLVASACRGPSSRVPCRDAAEPVGVSDKVAVPAQGSRKSAEAVDALRKLVAADRLAVEAGELRLAQLKSLAKAGRVSDPEMLAAELEVLKLRQKLQTRERDLEDAQQDAAAGDRPQAGARG